MSRPKFQYFLQQGNLFSLTSKLVRCIPRTQDKLENLLILQVRKIFEYSWFFSNPDEHTWKIFSTEIWVLIFFLFGFQSSEPNRCFRNSFEFPAAVRSSCNAYIETSFDIKELFEKKYLKKIFENVRKNIFVIWLAKREGYLWGVNVQFVKNHKWLLGFILTKFNFKIHPAFFG